MNCTNNTLGDECQLNKFKCDCYSNTFGYHCSNNIFEDECNNNTFGDDCGSNTFGETCSNNTFGNECSINVFKDDCGSNTFGDTCASNIFEHHCSNNTFGNDYTNNTFGNNCRYIVIVSDYGEYNLEGEYVLNNINYLKLGGNCQNLCLFTDSAGSTDEHTLQHVTIQSGVKGSSANTPLNIDLSEHLDKNYELKIAYNSKGELKQYCEADLVL